MALVIGACTLGVNAQEQRAVSRLESAAIETFADGFFAAQMARLQVPGAALAIVQGQRVVFSKGYGYADLAAKVPVDPERTLFRVGSVSKLLIATAVMQLYEERRLDLHADINTYLTRFKIRDRYSTPITLAHLLTHTAGFDERVIGMWARTRPAEPLGDHLAARMPPRVRPPGDVISYSNYGMALAAHIVENVAGMSYEHYVQKRILTPLEMYRSTFAYPTTLTARLATGYRHRRGGPEPLAYQYLKIPAAGSLQATVMDIARFMRAHLQTGQAGVVRILAEQTAREMHRQHFTQHPRLPGFCYGFWESFNNGRRAIQHGGSVQGYDVYLFLLPTEQVGLFVAQNGGIGELSGPFIDEFMDRFFPGHFTPPAVFPTQSPTPLESLAGWYRVTQRPLRTLDKLALLLRPHDVRVSVRPDGVLDVRTAYDGDGRVWLDGLSFVEVGPLHFRDSTGRYQMAFRTGTRGPASHLFTDAARHPVVFDSIAWYDRREIHWSVLIGCSIVFLSAGFRRSKGAEHRPSILSAKIRGSQLERAWLCAKVTSALNLIFAAAFPPYLLFGPIRLGYGEMGAVPLLLAVPVIATVLTVPLVLFAVQAWRADYWSVLARVHYTIVTLAALAFVWFLGYWNLLGLRY